MATKAELQFQASAYLQTLIGRELFRSEDVAVVELVKNAYDSGATLVTVTIRPPSEREPGEIVIEDNGSGMTLRNFEELFMFAGYSERPSEVETASRVPTGEKGIGRFASDRLGARLQVATKTKGQLKGLRVDIDWTRFSDRKKRFQDIKAPYTQEAITEIPEGSSGTILTITRLREGWDRSQIESLRRALGQLLDPFQRPGNFEIELNIQGSPALSGRISQEPIHHEDADIIIRFKIKDDGSIQRSRGGRLYRPTERESFRPTVSAETLAGLSGTFFYFLNRPRKDQTKGISPGVKVYRDGFRVEPFGSEAADWLGIATKRAKRAGHAHIVPSRLFGFVAISRRSNPKLQDTTSREALIDTEAARALVNVLGEQVSYLEGSIETDVAGPRWEESRKKKAQRSESAKLQTLNIMSIGLAHELRQPMQTIRTEASNINKRLKQLRITDNHIAAAQGNIDQSIQRIDRNIRLIAAISSGNTDVVTEFDLAALLRDECQLLATRCANKGIELIQTIPATQVVGLNQTTVTIALLNLVQNSIDAHDEVTDDRKKRISVSLSKVGTTNVVEVSDNALGIPEEVQTRIFKKFNTNKTGGWGVGLHNCQLLVRAQGGEIEFSTQVGVGSKFKVVMPNSKPDAS